MFTLEFKQLVGCSYVTVVTLQGTEAQFKTFE